MNILLLFTGFIFAFFVVLLYEYKIRQVQKECRNKAHFYVARDKDGALWLYSKKPFRLNERFYGGVINVRLSQHKINRLGLNKDDCDNLKWQDEPLEVFINTED